MEHKVDLRVVKTKKAIYNAFINLMNSKVFNKITVQDILDEALINRKTFYKYYKDKEDLAEQIATEFLNYFDKMLITRFSNESNNKDMNSIIDELYLELYNQRKEIYAIWNIQTEHINVLEEMSVRLQNIYEQLANKYNTKGDITLQSYMFSTFVLSSYKYIINTNKNYEVHQLLKEYKILYQVIEKTSNTKN